MKKIYLLLFTSLFVARSFAGIITSTGTGGNWSATSTWVGGIAPAAGDDVIIANGATVTIDASVNCTNLTVGQGTSGILQYNTTASARTLTVSGNMIINAGAIVRPGASGGFANSLTIAGNLTNNGTLTTAITTNYINLVFNGTVTSQTFTNTGTITSNGLRSLTINNTAGTVTIPSALSIASGATLTLTAGTLLVGAGGTGSITLGSAASGTFTCVRTNGSMVAATATYGAGVTTKTYTYNGTGTITTGIELTAAASVTIDVLSINNSTLNFILNKAINVNSALTLTNGIVNTTATNLLTLGTATAAGILTGGSATAFINGPIARTFAASRTASGTYNATSLFPVGKSGVYFPLYLDPSTASSGAVQLKCEAFDTNTGTFTLPVQSMASHRWEASTIAGSGNLTNIFIRQSDATISTSNKILNASTASGAYTNIAAVTNFASTLLTTANSMPAAEFNSSGFFSFGNTCNTASCVAPGGVSSFLTLWLKADAGTSTTTSGTGIASWQDQTIKDNDGIQVTAAKQPFYYDGSGAKAINYNPVAYYDGTVARFFSFGTSGALGINGANAPFTIIGISKQTVRKTIFATNNNGATFNPGDIDILYGNPGPTLENQGTVGLVSASNNCGDGNAYIQTAIRSSVNNQTFTGSVNGGVGNSATISSATFNTIKNALPYQLGYKGTSITGDFYTGSLAEFVIFNDDLVTSGDAAKVSSYFAIKYAITLDKSAGGTAGDYLLSNANTAWDASDNPSYHNGIIGVAKDDASGLLQKQSHTTDDSLRVFTGSLAGSNQTNTGSITNDLSSIIMGNDGGGPQWSTSVAKPASITSRLVRTFKVTNTNFTNNFSIEIKCDTIGGLYSLGNLRFLVSATTDFSAATVYAAPDVTFAFGSIIVNGISNSLIPANTTRYVTVGLSLTILPVELTAFNATAVHNKEVVLNWKISTTNNNPYFTVQKSADGKTWVDVTTVKGNADQTDFTVTDNDPFTSVSYYRLQKTTGNNEYRYSDIKKVSLRVNVTLHVYPNPVLRQVVIEGTTTELSQLKLFTVTGQDVSGQIQVISRNSSKIVVDLSRLSKGIYMMKTNTTVTKLFKQ